MEINLHQIPYMHRVQCGLQKNATFKQSPVFSVGIRNQLHAVCYYNFKLAYISQNSLSENLTPTKYIVCPSKIWTMFINIQMSSSAEHDHRILNDDIYDMSFIDYIHRVVFIFHNCNEKKIFLMKIKIFANFTTLPCKGENYNIEILCKIEYFYILVKTTFSTAFDSLLGPATSHGPVFSIVCTYWLSTVKQFFS